MSSVTNAIDFVPALTGQPLPRMAPRECDFRADQVIAE